jgi:hypothetical protein
VPLDGTNYLKADRRSRLMEVREVIWRARTNMAVPGRWARWNWGADGQFCCATHVALAAGTTEQQIRHRGIETALTQCGMEAFERLGGLRNIVRHNDDAKYTLEDVLKWMDEHINSLTREINALQRVLV